MDTLFGTLGTTSISTTLSSSSDTVNELDDNHFATSTMLSTTTTTASSLTEPSANANNQVDVRVIRQYVYAMTIEEQHDFMDLLDRKLARIADETEIETVDEVQPAKVYVKKIG